AVHIELAWHVFGILVFAVCHGKRELQAVDALAAPAMQWIFSGNHERLSHWPSAGVVLKTAAPHPMTPRPPPSPGDSPQPPKSRPDMGTSPGRQTEINLWDLDEAGERSAGSADSADSEPLAGQLIEPKPRGWKE